MEFKMIERQSLTVWLYSTKQIKELRKHGYVHYFSKKMKYAILYVDKNNAEDIAKNIENYFFVRQVDFSHRDEIDMTFSDSLDNNNESSSLFNFTDDIEEDSVLKSIAESLKNKNFNSK
ncbi:YlbG family protein [Aerococcaceae bacterium WGS1372]